MGATASINEEVRKDFYEHYDVVKSRYEAGQPPADVADDIPLNNALYYISQYCDDETYKMVLTESSLNLVPMLLWILSVYKGNIVGHSMVCLWYLSRAKGNRILFGTKGYGIVEYLSPMIIEKRIDDSVNYAVHSIIVNIMNEPSVLDYMLSDELGLLKAYVDLSTEGDSPPTWSFRMLGNIALAALPRHLQRLVDSKSYVGVVRKLLQSGARIDWSDKEGGDEYWCLNYTLAFVRHTEASTILRQLNTMNYFVELLQTNDRIEGLKAGCILSYMLGKQESIESSKSLLQQYPMILDDLLDIFKCTLNENQGPEALKLEARGYQFGIFNMRTITGALQRLSISDSNKGSMVECNVIKWIVCVLQRFINNTPELQFMQDYLLTAGGGGDDVESAEQSIDVLLQLAFYFTSDEELRSVFCEPKYDMLNLLTALSRHEQISTESKQNISHLLRKLQPQVVVSEVDESQVKSRKHVMLSYCE